MSYYTEVYHLGRPIAGWAQLGALQRYWQIYRQMRGRRGKKLKQLPEHLLEYY
jgi:hypothetical protein